MNDELYHYGVKGMKWGRRSPRYGRNTPKSRVRLRDPNFEFEGQMHKNKRMATSIYINGYTPWKTKDLNLTEREKAEGPTNTVQVSGQRRNALAEREKEQKPMDLFKNRNQRGYKIFGDIRSNGTKTRKRNHAAKYSR